MTSSAPAKVFADANALYPSALRDILIELTLEGVITLQWSPEVLDELVRALVRTRADTTPEKGLRMVAAMMEAVPGALVIPPDGTLPATALPDPDDVHVLAAALHGGCAAILTFNVRDFPADRLTSHQPDLEGIHPDAFLVQLLTTRASAVLPIIERVRQNLTRPPMSVAAYADSLMRSGLSQTGELLRHLLPTE